MQSRIGCLVRLSEADDAVQEAWLRLSGSDTSGIENLRGWLTTVIARLCLDLLRSRTSRREEPLEARVPDPIIDREGTVDPEQEALLADSVGLALLVVPRKTGSGGAARAGVARYVRHGVRRDRSNPGTFASRARQLASRARRRVHGAATVPDADLSRQREVVEAFLAAARGGDLNALLAVLDPDVVLRADRGAMPAGASKVVRGSRAVATQALSSSQSAKEAGADQARRL